MNDCIFCKIIKGDIPSYKVYENDDVYAFLDIHPANKGHTLVIPKKHARNIFDIPHENWSSVMSAVRLLAGTIEKAVGADGINLAMNNREHAGQVVDHTHVHIIPRFKGDGLRLMPGHAYKEGEAEQILSSITANIN